MRSSRVRSIVGIGMIVGSFPCTLAGVLIWYLTVEIASSRADRLNVGFDVIGFLMMSYVAFLIAFASCVAGLVYFGYAVLKKKEALKRWQSFAIVYSTLQIAIAVVYMSV